MNRYWQENTPQLGGNQNTLYREGAYPYSDCKRLRRQSTIYLQPGNT
jgi:hypothetical protein